VGCCVPGNEPLSAIKLVTFQEGFHSMGLVTEIQRCGVGIAFGVMGWLGSVLVTSIVFLFASDCRPSLLCTGCQGCVRLTICAYTSEVKTAWHCTSVPSKRLYGLVCN